MRSFDKSFNQVCWWFKAIIGIYVGGGGCLGLGWYKQTDFASSQFDSLSVLLQSTTEEKKIA